jgi:hypothetical protein
MKGSKSKAWHSRELSRLSASEMVDALGAAGAPPVLRRGLAMACYGISRRLGSTLADFDASIVELGLPMAAEQALRSFGVTRGQSGDTVGDGPCLVLANHPGAYDAFALMSAIGRKDLAILAADRRFLRALPGLSRHLLFVSEAAGARASVLKRALSWLRGGGAILHFPAGRIEPDADFERPGAPLLAAWQPGVSALTRALSQVDGQLYLAGVRGVHSPRAKRLLVNRWAEERGVTTLAPLLQMVLRLGDVTTRVELQLVPRFEATSASEQEAVLRSQLTSAILRA